jgi:hypothetical protein
MLTVEESPVDISAPYDLNACRAAAHDVLHVLGNAELVIERGLEVA